MAFLGIGALVGGGLFGAAVDFAVTAAVSIGISYAAQALAGKPAATTTDASFSTQGQLTFGGTVARCALFGYCATAGSLAYANTWGTSDDGKTPNAYITQVIALSDIPVAGLQGVWVNGQKCTLGTLDSEKGYAITEYNKAAKDYLWVKFYDGTQTTADGLCVNKVASTDRPYEATRVATGCAYAVCTALVEDTLYTGIPQFRFEIQGAKLYDITKDDTAGGSGDQRWSDPSTWGGDGDNLPAVQIYNILRGINYNGAWFYGLQNVTGAKLPYVSWSQAINKCRATVTGLDGLEPQYRTGGQINISAQVADTVQAILTGCQGRLSEVGGSYKLHVGEPDGFSASFTDDDILSTEEQSFSPFFGLSESINGISGNYPEPAEGWASKPAPDLYSAAFEAEDGNRRLMAAVQYDFVPYSEQVQRLMLSALNEARRARQHTIVLPPEYWPVEPGDFVSWTSERNGYTDKLFRVDGTTDKANLDVIVVLTEVDPSDYDWDHGDYQPPTLGQVGVIRVPAQGVLAWGANGYTLVDKDGFTRRPAIQLSWDGDVPGIVGVQYELAHENPATDEWITIDRNRTDQVAAGALIIWNGLLPDEPYRVRGQYIPNTPRDMLWSDWIDVTTPNVKLSLADFDAALHAQVTQIQDQLNEQLNEITQRIAAIAANQDARNWLDKQTIRTQLTSRSDAAFAGIDEVRTVATDTQVAFASFQTTVTAQFGTVNASITTNSTAIATLNGYAAAQYSVTLNVNGYATGFNLLNGGSGTSAFIVVSDKFQVQQPGYNGSAPLSVFTIGTNASGPAIGISGNLYLDGTITARMMNVGTLSAITANVGTLTAGTIQSASGKMVMNLTAGTLIISD
ncbi:phage tail protein [Bradyrhizobium australafricanum]|uniref:phage tail protein n=1 Tax=Bradyrhizobium australafricanum TaxID=2821406 RepID=UPI001CE29BAF|nr:phage tail protein [Bradyrhizobium australafricanum]MCA6098873.1 DUF1983 domain-containing protein [Bradyrhizobium australafricanum]